jgi:hypothetical protein
MSVQGKTKRKSHLEPDVAMMLLTTRIQKVDRQLAQGFGRFNRISESNLILGRPSKLNA